MNMLKGTSRGVVKANTRTLMKGGMKQHEAVVKSLKSAGRNNLGKFLHPKKKKRMMAEGDERPSGTGQKEVGIGDGDTDTTDKTTQEVM